VSTPVHDDLRADGHPVCGDFLCTLLYNSVKNSDEFIQTLRMYIISDIYIKSDDFFQCLAHVSNCHCLSMSMLPSSGTKFACIIRLSWKLSLMGDRS
jgi:hypothetical protein